MALAGFPSPSVKAFVEALGLRDCRAVNVRVSVDDPVTVNAECYARSEQLDRLTGEIVKRRMVLIDADEYERLKHIDRLVDGEGLRRALAAGSISVNDARAALGLPPLEAAP